MLMMSACSDKTTNYSFNGDDTHRTEQTGITTAITAITFLILLLLLFGCWLHTPHYSFWREIPLWTDTNKNNLRLQLRVVRFPGAHAGPISFQKMPNNRFAGTRSVTDLAHAVGNVMVIVDGSARSWIKRRHVVHEEPIEVAAPWQLDCNMPNMINALVHRACQ